MVILIKKVIFNLLFHFYPRTDPHNNVVEFDEFSTLNVTYNTKETSKYPL